MPLRSRIGTWQSTLGRLLSGSDPRDDAALVESIAEARRQWLCARSQFNYVNDPDLVDHVVFSIDAAEKRYMFLLREARDRGVSVSPSLHAIPLFRG